MTNWKNKETISERAFFEEYLQPLYDKYQENENFIQVCDDGEKIFDIQKVMLHEQQVFTPLTNEKGRVYGFSIKGHPYKFIDTRYSDDIPLIMMNIMDNYVENDGETTPIITYFGCNECFIKGSEGEKEYLEANR